MPLTTIVFGGLLMLLGVGGYLATDRISLTALIPVIPGLVFVFLGAVAHSPRARKHVMHAAAAIALLCLLAMIPSGIVPLVRWLSGTTPARPPAVISRCIMAALMLIFLVMCIKSFVDARRRPASSRGFEPVEGQ